MKKTKTLVLSGLLIALTIVLSRVLSIQPLPYLRIGFSFIPVAAAGILLGPAAGGCVAALADIVGFFLFPSGTYFPGITLSALLTGLVYGFLLYRKKPSVVRLLLASAITSLLIEGCLTSVWLTILIPGKTFWAILIARLINALVMIPVKTVVLYAVWRLFAKMKPAGGV